MKRSVGRPKATYDSVIPYRLKEVRTKIMRMTQFEFAELLGHIDQKTVSNWEKGKTNCPEEKLREIALKCNVDYDWLNNTEGKKAKKYAEIIAESQKILEPINTKEFEVQDSLERLMLKLGYTLPSYQMEHINFVPYMLKSIEDAIELSGLTGEDFIIQQSKKAIARYELLHQR